MNKRNIMLLAVLSAFSFAFVGCDDGVEGDPDTGVTPDPDGGMMDPDTGVDPDPDGGMMMAEPRGMENPPIPGAGSQIDRIGRPAVSTATIGTFNGDETERGMTKDAYNADMDRANWVTTWAPAIAGALAIYDGADTNCGNQLAATPVEPGNPIPADRYATLAGVLADDVLYVNSTSDNCFLYIGVEAQALGLLPDGGCGGRIPSYDVIRTSYSVFIAGTLADIDDGIVADDAEDTTDPDTFPFLSAPL